MSDSATSQTRGCSGSGRVVTRNPPTVLQVLLVSLLVALVAVGCSGGQGNVVVMFPQHDAPLGTDNGGHYFAGQLALDEGCLRAEVPEDANSPASSWLLIWPSGFTLAYGRRGRTDSGWEWPDRRARGRPYSSQPRDRLLSGSPRSGPDTGVVRGLRGSQFSGWRRGYRLRSQQRAHRIALSDPDVLFPRQTTTIASVRELLTAAGFGELALNGHCLGLKDGDTIIWPAGFTPHVDQGVVQIRNGAGRTIAKVGDRIAGGGGFSSSELRGLSRGHVWDPFHKSLAGCRSLLPQAGRNAGD